MKILNKEFYKTEHYHDWEDTCDILCPEGTHDLPNYATSGSAGIDLICTEDVIIYPGETKMIPTGLAIWIGSHDLGSWCAVVGFMLPRSGLGTKGLVLANTVGLIDEDYQGELMVSAWNRIQQHDYEDVNEVLIDTIKLKAGDRFAQLVFMPVIKAQFEIVEEFSNETQRGTSGFGSTDRRIL